LFSGKGLKVPYKTIRVGKGTTLFDVTRQKNTRVRMISGRPRRKNSLNRGEKLQKRERAIMGNRWSGMTCPMLKGLGFLFTRGREKIHQRGQIYVSLIRLFHASGNRRRLRGKRGKGWPGRGHLQLEGRSPRREQITKGVGKGIGERRGEKKGKAREIEDKRVVVITSPIKQSNRQRRGGVVCAQRIRGGNGLGKIGTHKDRQPRRGRGHDQRLKGRKTRGPSLGH